MSQVIDLNKAYGPSEDVVVREIKGETIIVPLTSGIGDIEDELYHVDKTGPEILRRLDGSRPLGTVIRELAAEYDAPEWLIEEEVVEFLQELLDRRIIVEKG